MVGSQACLLYIEPSDKPIEIQPLPHSYVVKDQPGGGSPQFCQGVDGAQPAQRGSPSSRPKAHGAALVGDRTSSMPSKTARGGSLVMRVVSGLTTPRDCLRHLGSSKNPIIWDCSFHSMLLFPRASHRSLLGKQWQRRVFMNPHLQGLGAGPDELLQPVRGPQGVLGVSCLGGHWLLPTASVRHPG